MKGEELHLGDWVLCGGRNYRIGSFINVESDVADIDDGKDFGTFAISRMKPVHLTKEILEHNGWRNIHGDFFTLEEGDVNSIIDLGDDMVSFVINGENSVNYRFKSVHELQHALSMCGSSKKIELL